MLAKIERHVLEWAPQPHYKPLRQQYKHQWAHDYVASWMNIHTQQNNCEAEIAAGAWGPATLKWLFGTAAIHLDADTAPSAKLANCCQDWTGQAMSKRWGGPGSDRLDILDDQPKINKDNVFLVDNTHLLIQSLDMISDAGLNRKNLQPGNDELLALLSFFIVYYCHSSSQIMTSDADRMKHLSCLSQ